MSACRRHDPTRERNADDVRAVLRTLHIWVHDETLPLHAFAPAVPVVVFLIR